MAHTARPSLTLSALSTAVHFLLSLHLPPISGRRCINYSCLCMDVLTAELSTRALRVVTLHLSIPVWHMQSLMRMQTHMYTQPQQQKVVLMWCNITWLQVKNSYCDIVVELIKQLKSSFCSICPVSHPELIWWHWCQIHGHDLKCYYSTLCVIMSIHSYNNFLVFVALKVQKREREREKPSL